MPDNNTAAGVRSGGVSAGTKITIEQLGDRLQAILDNPATPEEHRSAIGKWLVNDRATLNTATPEDLNKLAASLVKTKLWGLGDAPVSKVGIPATFPEITYATAPTVKKPSRMSTKRLDELAAIINKVEPVPQEKIDALKAGGLEGKALNDAVKVLGVIIHPGIFPDGAMKRTKDNIEASTGAAYDFDFRNGDRTSRTDVLTAAEAKGVAVILWNTYSSGIEADDKDMTFRAVFAFAESQPTDTHAGRCNLIAEHLGFTAPGKPLSVVQGFFVQPRLGRTPNAVAVPGRCIDEVVDFSNLPVDADVRQTAQEPRQEPNDPLDALSDQQVAEARIVIAQMRDKGLHLSNGKGVWHQVIGALANYGEVGANLCHEFSVGDPQYKPADVERKIKDKLKSGVTGIGQLFKIAAENGIENPGKGKRPAAEDDFAAELEAAPFEVAEQKAAPLPVDWPPGLVGEVAHYIHGSSIMPVKSFAIAGALSLVSHLMMNRASVGAMETPTNLYQVLIGDTGHGKEDPRSAIKRLLSATHNLDGLLEEATSDTALLRALNAYPVQLMMTDEFGIFLKSALSKQGDKHRQVLIGLLLKLFGLARSVLSPKAFADTKLNIPAIHGPYINLLGTTTPVQFVGALTGVVVDDGTLNRMLCVSASGTSPKNRNPSRTVPDALRDRLRLFADLLNPTLPGGTILIDTDAEQVFVRFYNETPTGLYAALWSRHEEHARRVAGVIAAGGGGVIQGHHAEWAVSYVRWCLTNVSREVSQGMAESAFEVLVLKALRFIRDARKYAGDREYGQLAKRGLMPRGKLSKLMRMKTRELDEVIAHLTESGEIGTAKDGQSAVYFPR